MTRDQTIDDVLVSDRVYMSFRLARLLTEHGIRTREEFLALDPYEILDWPTGGPKTAFEAFDIQKFLLLGAQS